MLSSFALSTVLCFLTEDRKKPHRLRIRELLSSQRQSIACSQCGHVYDMPECAVGEQMQCVYCEHVILERHPNWETKVLALTVTGLVLFLLANIFPFLGLEQAGQSQQSNLISGVQALILREEFLLAALIFLTIFLFPLLELLGLTYIITFRMLRIKAPYLGQTLRLLKMSEPWSMLEIFLIGVLISSVKLAGMASLVPGIGLYAFLGLVVALLAAHQYIDRYEMWAWLEPLNCYVHPDDEGRLHGCKHCAALVCETTLSDDNACPRCDSSIYPIWPRSQQKTAALLIASTILFIPANTLPIMTTTNLGQTSTDTIFSGVVHLAQAGDVPIALLVFVASIVIPIAKLIVMAVLLWWIGRPQSLEQARQRTKLFHITEFIGRWSMIDVYVVSILVALVQFGLLANVEPGPALLCFAGVVVLTMMAAETFDAKLLWQNDNLRAEYSAQSFAAEH